MAATIYDVAKKAGVSTATVSKVLSNTPYVSHPTRAKVLIAVEELGYVPSLAARGLSKARTYIIGLVIPYTADYLYTDPHLLDLIRGIEEEAQAHNYHVLLSTGGRARADGKGSTMLPHPLQRILGSRYVDGAVVVASSVLKGRNVDLAVGPFPLVGIGYHAAGGRHTVHVDDREGAAMATRHLLALGHQRIGVISATPPITALARRLEGYHRALDEAGITYDPDLVAWGDFSDASGYAAAGQLLALQPRPTAIFAFNDRMAMGAIRRLREADLMTPGDMAVTGFDDIPAAALFDPPLTTVRQPAQDMGTTAARLLLEDIEGRLDQAQEVVLPAELILRASCGARTKEVITSPLA